MQSYHQQVEAKLVKVRLLGGLAAVVGGDEIEVLVRENETVKELLEKLIKTYPQLEPLVRGELGELNVVIVCNNKILDLKDVISNCREVVLAPFSSGG